MAETLNYASNRSLALVSAMVVVVVVVAVVVVSHFFAFLCLLVVHPISFTRPGRVSGRALAFSYL